MNIEDLKKQLESQIKETIENGIGIIQAFQEIEDVNISVVKVSSTEKNEKIEFCVSVSIDTKSEKEKTYRPYNFSELYQLYFHNAKLQFKNSNLRGNIVGFNKEKKGAFILVLRRWVGAEALLENWQWPNGDPCGVEEERIK